MSRSDSWGINELYGGSRSFQDPFRYYYQQQNDTYEVLRANYLLTGSAYTKTQTVTVSRWATFDAALEQVNSPRDGETILLRNTSTGDVRAFKVKGARVTFEPVRL